MFSKLFESSAKMKSLLLKHLILFGIFSLTNSDGDVSFKAVLCKVSDRFIYPNASCYAKSYSRKISTLNVYVMFRDPLYAIFVSRSFLKYKLNTLIDNILFSCRERYCSNMGQFIEKW